MPKLTWRRPATDDDSVIEDATARHYQALESKRLRWLAWLHQRLEELRTEEQQSGGRP